jgi:hypothetical protein
MIYTSLDYLLVVALSLGSCSIFCLLFLFLSGLDLLFYKTALIYLFFVHVFCLLQKKDWVGMLYTRHISTFGCPLFSISPLTALPQLFELGLSC